jgi:toxin-antitoxin system, toxin component, fic family
LDSIVYTSIQTTNLPQFPETSAPHPQKFLPTFLFIGFLKSKKFVNFVVMEDQNEIIIYSGADGGTRIEVKFTGETVWLSQQQLCELYATSKANVSEHIKHIFEDAELDKESVVRKFRTTAADGKSYNVTFYNLDMIISLGYRIRSVIATHFRRWATERLKEYIIKGFTIDDERLKGNGGGAYWHELLDRIRDIRSSEKVMYRQVLDLYATAVDYDPRSETSVKFFKIVQNKLHFAAHGHTASELIFKRADADAPMMGLTSFKGDHPTLRDAQIAKNYLSENELKILNNLVSGYFDFAEIQAMKRRPVYMSDYVRQLDTILSSTGEALLNGPGTVSHQQAMDKAREEYRKFQIRELSPVEHAYLDTIKALNAKAAKK